jgi:hypothetical protein
MLLDLSQDLGKLKDLHDTLSLSFALARDLKLSQMSLNLREGRVSLLRACYKMGRRSVSRERESDDAQDTAENVQIARQTKKIAI